MTPRQVKAVLWFQKVVLRGIEGMIADRYLGILVKAEWVNAAEADEAMRNQFEAKHMAEQVYAQLKGEGL